MPFVTTKDRVASEFRASSCAALRSAPCPAPASSSSTAASSTATPPGRRSGLWLTLRACRPEPAAASRRGREIDRVDYDDEAVWLDGVPRARDAPRRPFVRRRDRAARGGAAAGAAPLADGGRAAGDARRARRSGRGRGSRRRRAALGAGPAGPGGVPARLPRTASGHAVPPGRFPRGAAPGRAAADGGAVPMAGGDPAGRARSDDRSRSWPSPAGTAPASRRSATCSPSGSAPSGPSSRARAMRSQRLGEPFNELLAAFVEWAEARAELRRSCVAGRRRRGGARSGSRA